MTNWNLYDNSGYPNKKELEMKMHPWERSREIQYFNPEMYIYYKNNLKLHEQDDEHLNDTQIQQKGLYNSVLNKEGSSN